MKYSKAPSKGEADVWKSMTLVEVNFTGILASIVALASIGLVALLFSVFMIKSLGDSLVEAQLKKNLIVVETKTGQLEEVDRIPENMIFDFVESFSNNMLNWNGRTFDKNMAFARSKLDTALDASMQYLFEEKSRQVQSQSLSQSWYPESYTVNSGENNTQVYRIQGVLKAWTANTQYIDKVDYIEVTLARGVATVASPLGLRVVKVDGPMFRDSR